MASQQPIFRTITVAHGQTVTLGQPVPTDVWPLTEADGLTGRKMIKGDFGGAESIRMQLAAEPDPHNAPVQNITFAYAPGTDYTGMVNAFMGELGQPASQTPDSALWQDPQTSFEVYNRGSVGSQLTNLAPLSAA